MINKSYLKEEIKKIYARHSISRNGFWFVDIPRTSSTSIRSELGDKFGMVYGKRNVMQKNYSTRQIIPDHLPATEISSLVGEKVWNKIFTFTIIRNPWDRVFSMYNYRRKVKDVPLNMNFHDYVVALCQSNRSSQYFEYHGYRYGLADYIVDKEGNILVDYIAKYENREEDIKYIRNQLNIDSLGHLLIQNATPKNESYVSFYDDKTIDLVRNYYKRDIEIFNYDFAS